jgi:primosomal protein N' (replication factor Y)
MRFVEVAVPLPLDTALHYAVPDGLLGKLQVGESVVVPLGNRRVTGYVLKLGDTAPTETKPVIARAAGEPLFGEELAALYAWVARYYVASLGEVVRTAVPGVTRTASRRTVRLLDGATAIAGQPLIERLRASSSGALTERVVLREGLGAALRDALRKGLVAVEQGAGPEAPKVRAEPVYTLRGSVGAARSAFARPGPVRDRLIDWLGRFPGSTRSAIRDAFPSGDAALRALIEANVVDSEQRTIDPEAAERAPLDPADRAPRAPTPSQSQALDALRGVIGSGYAAFLLHGVTGSGKTEVYLQAAAYAVERGGSAIFLVPEIGLTPQFLGRFRARFGERAVAVLHSALTERERLDEWLRIARGDARIVVGPRSAVWAPARDLRLLVVDEEHDPSYKQEDGLRYHARDVALARAHRAGAVCVLGSATPSLEALQLVDCGKARVLSLPARVHGRPLPGIEVVDLRLHPADDPDAPSALLSPPLRDAIETTRAAGEQAILLLNRRGFAPTVLCTSCGSNFRCDDCDVSLTYHGRRNHLVCHGCGAAREMPNACPACSGFDTLRLTGRGTERLEDELLALFPGLRVDRMDADTTRSRAAHRRILDRFRAGEIDVLVGTQMVAKGHDFPRVTLVGVLQADAALHLPDFRAAERTFQLVVQVSGRAGRGDLPGRVIVQTHHPDHHAIRCASTHDVERFVARERALRQGLRYPPYARMAMVRVSGPDERAVHRAAHAIRAAVDDLPAGRLVRTRGPAPAPLYRLKGRYRWTVMLLAEDHGRLSAVLQPLRELSREIASRAGHDTRVVLDRDPVGML